ncbi:hypothetical protein J2Z32_000422 [Paenibacillus turicensis]|uniref:Peptidase C-terminal archaeal/bacterial domain-containing protein n=1 Tax=Paenibacillus turicensis TaxID=160487 RepID=A0ABS4FML0_9BACL|nr:hypothetical protein [Paenibacillus turicensis]MBP1903810.1 hypothetical protein [Paenibacillus turicensis]
MFRLKKLLPLMVALIMIFGMNSNVFATDDVPNVNDESEGIVQKISNSDFDQAEKMEAQDIQKITVDDSSFPQLNVNTNFKIDTLKNYNNIENNTTQGISTNSTWQINDPVFVGDGKLTGAYDIYLVNASSNRTAALKLAASSSELIAQIFIVDAQGNLQPSNFIVNANSSDKFGALPSGTYAIVIGSSSGKVTGTYTLMWNCSNPSGAKSIINRTSDLARVVLFYSNNEIRSNGDNIITNLKWEEHETWYLPLGYSARDMSISAITSKGTYLASFNSSKPYTANNALLIDVSKGSYLYFNSYYSNDKGDVVHVMNYIDPSGLKTPRTLGNSSTDFDWGNHYIVINLDTFEVAEFLSPFNYHYTKDGGRTYSLNNVTRVE